jgi:uncharacterized membrane protein (UPF0127 family)
MMIQEMAVGRRRFSVEVAMEILDIEKGLSGRETLPRNRGMLVVLPHSGYGINMSQMKFDLDVGFLDAKGAISEIGTYKKGVDETIEPIGNDIRYFLKMPSGWFEANNIGAGEVADYVVRTPLWMVYDVVASMPIEEEQKELTEGAEKE